MSWTLPEVQIVSVQQIDGLAQALPRTKKHFTLLLAWDVPSGTEPQLVEILSPLIDTGMVYLCAWGDQCELVHDAVDEYCVREEIEHGEADYLVMTTCHHDETFAEAFWFFDNLAVPAEPDVFHDFERFVVTVGNPSWATEVLTALAERPSPTPQPE